MPKRSRIKISKALDIAIVKKLSFLGAFDIRFGECDTIIENNFQDITWCGPVNSQDQ